MFFGSFAAQHAVFRTTGELLRHFLNEPYLEKVPLVFLSTSAVAETAARSCIKQKSRSGDDSTEGT